jgi:hypothetical protein
MEREEALSILTKPPLPETEVFELKEYVCKKLGISNKEFDDLMKLPIKSHYDYATDQQMRKFLFSLNRRLRKTN